MKISDDKYYTPIDVVEHVYSKIKEICPIKFGRVIEPSCGNGAFFHDSEISPTLAFDIKPECKYPCVVNGDYLAQKLDYEKNTLVIGNPPYGEHLSLAIKFFKKSAQISDYIAFILPISQLNSNKMMYEFNLIYSEDLGIKNYSGKELHCCFNIYKRPDNGILNHPQSDKVDDITIYRQDCRDYDKKPFDVRMCYWGNGSAGKILTNDEHYSGEYKIKINRKDLYDEIYRVLTTYDWKNEIKGIAMKRIKQYNIIDVLKSNVKGFGTPIPSINIPTQSTPFWRKK